MQMVNSALRTCERLQEKGRRSCKLHLVTQVHFVPWTVLEYDFVPSVLNIYIQFLRHVYSF